MFFKDKAKIYKSFKVSCCRDLERQIKELKTKEEQSSVANVKLLQGYLKVYSGKFFKLNLQSSKKTYGIRVFQFAIKL